jgi:hypothetical protein
VPSSPNPPLRTRPYERLVEALEAVPDRGVRRGLRRSLAELLALAVTATAAGCRIPPNSATTPGVQMCPSTGADPLKATISGR